MIFLNNQNGITLIALVITIIIMLILAGVSINAIVGDNGIITQAQKTVYLQGCAILEEYFNEYYASNISEFLDSDEAPLFCLKNDQPNWFYNPPLGYIVDKRGMVYYLINKDGLPEELKAQVKGGEAGDKSYQAYSTLNDVYGVTSDLKVYYCKNGSNNIVGNVNIDKDDPNREIFSANSEYAKLINGNDEENVTANDIKKISTLTIDEESGIKELSKLYNFISLQELVLKNVNFKNLSGIENISKLRKITLYNTVIEDTSELASIKTLEDLKIEKTTNDEISKILTSMKNTDYTNLNSIAIIISEKEVSDVSKLGELTDASKKAVKTIKLYSNNIKDIDCLENFSNVTNLEIYNNIIESLYVACSNMNQLQFLIAYGNNLTDDIENGRQALGSLTGKTELLGVNLSNNKDLKYLSGLSTHIKIYDYFYLAGCPSLLESEVSCIADIYNNAYKFQKNIDGKYQKNLASKSIYLLGDKTLTDTSPEIVSLENLSTSAKNEVKAIQLQNNPQLSNNKINLLLKQFPNLISVNLNGCTNLTSLEFVQNTPNLKEILFKDTGVTGTSVSVLDTYCNKIVGIECNNPDIDLTCMQKTLSGLKRDITGTIEYYALGGMRIGELASKLNQCTNLTGLELTGLSYKGTIDLSACVNSVDIGFSESTAYKVVLPPKVSSIRLNNNVFDYSSCKEINILQLESRDINTLASMCLNVEKYGIKIKMFNSMYGDWKADTLSTYKDEKNNIDAIGLNAGECLNRLNNANVEEILLGFWNRWKNGEYSIEESKSCNYDHCFDTLDFSNGFENLKKFYTYNTLINNLNFLANCSNLEVIDCPGAKINNIDGIKNLRNLKQLNLKNNNIIGLDAVKNLNQLKILNVENNLIQDISYADSVPYSNVDILVDLNKKGALRKVYIEDNDIYDIEELRKIRNWEEYSGF